MAIPEQVPVNNQDVMENNMALVQEIQKLKAHIHPPVPNPAPLGLIGFGLTTALLQMKHTRIAGDSVDDMNGVDTVTMGFAMFFGGLLQVRNAETISIAPVCIGTPSPKEFSL
jgi:succinate-acetate transporter protein